jgi:hypothetical protein
MDHLTLSRLPFLAAFAIALVAMPCDVYAFNQRGLGVDHALPWTSRTSAAVDAVKTTLASFRNRWRVCSVRTASAARSRATS